MAKSHWVQTNGTLVPSAPGRPKKGLAHFFAHTQAAWRTHGQHGALTCPGTPGHSEPLLPECCPLQPGRRGVALSASPPQQCGPVANPTSTAQPHHRVPERQPAGDPAPNGGPASHAAPPPPAPPAPAWAVGPVEAEPLRPPPLTPAVVEASPPGDSDAAARRGLDLPDFPPPPLPMRPRVFFLVRS